MGAVLERKTVKKLLKSYYRRCDRDFNKEGQLVSRVWRHTFHRNWGFWRRKREKLPGVPQGAKTTRPSLFYLVVVQSLKLCPTLRPQGLQHSRLPRTSLSLSVCSNSCSLSQWCHSTISSSVTRFSSCPQSVPESGSFPMSWLFTSGGQSVGPWERYKKSTVKTVKFPLNKLTQSRGWRLGQFFLVTNWVPEGTAGGLGAEKGGRTVRLESAHCFVEAGFLGGDTLGVLGFWWCVCTQGLPRWH